MKLHRVTQHLVLHPIPDLEAEVHRQLDAPGMDPPKGDVAITGGSRGISNIALITKAAGDWLRKRGARPFLAPCMGSHNGGTAEGQRAMVESLGMTEAFLGMEIRSSMDVVKVGTVSTGDVWMDRNCFEAAGVLVLNRVKLHTCFSGPLQSGLVKMMVIGMGKIPSATTFHTAKPEARKDMLVEMGRCMLASGRIFAGLAILEDGNDQTAELHALRPAEIIEKERALLERHRHYFPQLPVDELKVLVVDEIGKTYSGTGMDTNVIGFRGVRGGEDLTRPFIQVIAALNLAAASQGNAIGVGLADFITQRLRDAINEQKTFLNVFTTGDMRRMAIPCTLRDDEELVARLRERYGDTRWMFIPNTLHLETLYVTPDLGEELRAHPRCEVAPEPVDLAFSGGRIALPAPFSGGR